VDALGSVLNKEAVLKCLIEKSMPSRFAHVRSIKDVYNVYFTLNQKFDPALQLQSGAGLEGAVFDSPFECSITGRPANGQHSFSALKTCGHVFSDKGLEKTDSENPTCFLCEKPFTKSDILPLNPDDELLEALRANIQLQIKEKKIQKKERSEGKKKKLQQDKKEEKDIKEEKGIKEEKNKKEEKVEKKQITNRQTGGQIGKGNEKVFGVIPEEKETNGKRKANVDIQQPKKKQKVFPASTNGPSVHGVLAVQAALQQLGDSHDAKKNSSEAYKSIFSSQFEKQIIYLTGTSKAIIK